MVMLMKLLQALIIFAVLCANIYWHWTPNGLLAAILGIIAAYLLTVLPVQIYHLALTLKQKLVARLGQQQLR